MAGASPHCSHAISLDVSGKISELVNSVERDFLGLGALAGEPGRGHLGLCCLENESFG